ncbi:hypothetical protein NLU13_7917 [Sarocladium strictum]|uniref:BZIP domain-containing protein n=1 Tax=Sarocladium strictum TaxID=5046 RepID=A0AA39L5N4_SARSR|nr:hypothetical protein NLU13_7917 [Sarocladium strictum]
MAMETDVSFLGQSLDLPLDATFSDFANQGSLLDPRTHLSFDQTLAGKPSPGTPSQFLLTPSSLWDRPTFDDASMDIFADFTEASDQASDQQQPTQSAQSPQEAPDETSIPNQASVPAILKIKEESPLPAVPPPATRRLTRATSSGSQATHNSILDKVSAASSDGAKVKKSRTTSKRTTKRTKAQTKDKQASKEDEMIDRLLRTEDGNQAEEQPTGEEDVRRNKFLERNRVAASKCRQKKKEWMHSLEETKTELEKQHNTLHETLNGLLAEISVLKEHLMIHANCGDPNIDQWFATEARKFVESKTRADDARRPSSSSGSGETQFSSRSSVVQYSPTSSVAPPTVPSPKVKNETFSYDYMPDDMFANDHT